MNNKLKLQSQDFITENTSELFDKIVEDVYDREIDYDNLENFKKPIRNLILICDMHFQVMNGGVLQFVDNSTGDFFEETLTALKEIKAFEFSDILYQMKNKFPNGIIPKNTEDRRDLIDEINDNLTEDEENELDELYEKIDDEYYDSEELLQKYIIEYTKEIINK